VPLRKAGRLGQNAFEDVLDAASIGRIVLGQENNRIWACTRTIAREAINAPEIKFVGGRFCEREIIGHRPYQPRRATVFAA
jgi:hypothetical protein